MKGVTGGKDESPACPVPAELYSTHTRLAESEARSSTERQRRAGPGSSMDQFPERFDGGCCHGWSCTYNCGSGGEGQAAPADAGQQHGGHGWEASSVQRPVGLHCQDRQE